MSLSTESFVFVADLVRRRSAIQLDAGKEYLVESRLAPLARAAGVDVDGYVREVRSTRREADLVNVVEALTTNETSWFRDSSPFMTLGAYVVPTLQRERGRLGRVRVWSAACSTGQEPYSIAMVLADALPVGTTVEILATDLSLQVLAQARSGRYSQLEINRGLPASMLVRHLQRDGVSWQVADALRRVVTFAQHNLLDPPPQAPPFDVVYLRNVLIYFDIETKRAILGRIRRALAPDGFLVLGSAETTLGVDDGWERVAIERGSVYRPVRASARTAAPAPAPPLPNRAIIPNQATRTGAARPPVASPSPSVQLANQRGPR